MASPCAPWGSTRSWNAFVRADGLKAKSSSDRPHSSRTPRPGPLPWPALEPTRHYELANPDRSGRKRPVLGAAHPRRRGPIVPPKQDLEDPRRREMIITPSIFGLVDPPPRRNMNRYEFMVFESRRPAPEAPRKNRPPVAGVKIRPSSNGDPLGDLAENVYDEHWRAPPSTSRSQRTHQTRDAQVENARRLSGPQTCRASCIGNSAPSGSSRLTTNSAISSTSRL